MDLLLHLLGVCKIPGIVQLVLCCSSRRQENHNAQCVCCITHSRQAQPSRQGQLVIMTGQQTLVIASAGLAPPLVLFQASAEEAAVTVQLKAKPGQLSSVESRSEYSSKQASAESDILEMVRLAACPVCFALPSLLALPCSALSALPCLPALVAPALSALLCPACPALLCSALSALPCLRCLGCSALPCLPCLALPALPCQPCPDCSALPALSALPCLIFPALLCPA